MIKNITPETAHEWITANEAFLIDVREENEFAQNHIEQATLAPLSILPQAIENTDIPDNKKIIFQCLKGGRSAQAIEFLQENRLKGRDLYNMEGGILAWIEADLPIKTP